MRALGVVAVLVLLAVACGDDSGGGEAGGTTTSSATSAAPTTSLPTPLEVEVTEDVRYHDDIDGYREPLLDVYAPTEGGPWPVVVIFHEGGGLIEDKEQWDLLAPLVAEQGAVVVTPTYGLEQADDLLNVDLGPQYLEIIGAERACAMAFVTEMAEDFGGSPDDVIAFGASGGATVAGETVWDENEADEGCVSQAEPAVPHTLALDEGDLMLSVTFDPLLASGEVDFDEATVWDDLARSEETDVHLLLGSEVNPIPRISVGDPFDDEECGREIEPGTGLDLPGDGECVWWELRDPDGAFREDAQRLGLFDDGWFHVSEQTLLLADRLEAIGQDPTITTIEGLSHGTDRQEATLLAPALIDIVRG
jgi:hypothetical protein